ADHWFLASAFRFIGEELRCVFFGASADFADHDDRLGLVIGQELFQHIDEVGPVDRVAADPYRGGLAEALVGGLEHGFVGERAGAADHSDAALLENVAGHDPDLAFAGGEDAGTVRPDEARAGTGQRPLHLHHVEHRDALGDGDDQRHFRVDRFKDGVGGEWRRDVDDAGRGAGFLDRFRDRVEYRQVEVSRPALAGGHAADDLRAVSDRLLRVKAAGLAGHALDNDPRVLVDENAHASAPSICLHATSSSLTASTDLSKFALAAS